MFQDLANLTCERVDWRVICQKKPLMLRNRYEKDIGGISIGQKIVHKKPQEGVVLTPSLGIGGIYPSLLHSLPRPTSPQIIPNTDLLSASGQLHELYE